MEFRLDEVEGGTRLRVIESGFDKVPAHRREEAFPAQQRRGGPSNSITCDSISPASAAPPFRVRDAAPLFAALGDETRLRLLLRLSRSGPGSIARLSESSTVTRQAITDLERISQHWDDALERLRDFVEG